MLSVLNLIVLCLHLVQKGVSANMLKASSKRRRTRKEIAKAKEAEANREGDIQAKFAEIAAAQEKLNNYDELYTAFQNSKAVIN